MEGILIFWIIVALGAIAIDLATNTFLFVWFTVGALAAITANLLGFSTLVQVIIFIVISTFLVIVVYPIAKKTIKKTVPKTLKMEESYVGRKMVAQDEIAEKGVIKIDGIYWTVSNEGELIQKGDRIQISGIEGNKLLVKKIN